MLQEKAGQKKPARKTGPERAWTGKGKQGSLRFCSYRLENFPARR
jgi:hypothetical protein